MKLSETQKKSILLNGKNILKECNEFFEYNEQVYLQCVLMTDTLRFNGYEYVNPRNKYYIKPKGVLGIKSILIALLREHEYYTRVLTAYHMVCCDFPKSDKGVMGSKLPSEVNSKLQMDALQALIRWNGLEVSIKKLLERVNDFPQCQIYDLGYEFKVKK